jgi:hypothetical protein
MKLINNSFDDSLRNIVNECKSNKDGILNCPYITMDNLEYALYYNDKERLHRVLYYVEDNYDTFHKGKDYNKAYYMFKTIHLIKNYPYLINSLSDSNVALLATETPFEIDKEENFNRLYALSCDDFLSYARILYPRFTPSDTICSFLNHFDSKGLKRVNEYTINIFRRDELNALDKDKNKYYKELNELRGKKL